MRCTLFAILVICLASCGSVVPSTVAWLNGLDPLTADPGAIEVAVILPQGLQIAPGSASLVLSATSASGQLEEAFVLQPSPLDVTGITVPTGANGHVLRLAPADVGRMRAVQTRVRTWKQKDPSGTNGSFSVSVGGCGVDAGPAKDAKASVLIRTTGDAAFLPLVQNAGLRDVLGPDLFDAIKPCTSAQ